jgi:hypothetical protein
VFARGFLQPRQRRRHGSPRRRRQASPTAPAASRDLGFDLGLNVGLFSRRR